LITLFLIENNHLIDVNFTGLIGQKKCKGFPPALKFMHLEEALGISGFVTRDASPDVW